MQESNDAPCVTDSEDVESDEDDPYESDKEEDGIINGRKCKKCGNLVKGHPLPRGLFCQLSPVSFDKLEKQKALHKDKDRVRNATEEARAKARDRNATFYQILPWGKIAPGFLVNTNAPISIVSI